MKSLLPALALACIAVAPAHAGDPRLVERLYDPSAVVRIEGRPNVQATITFGDGEHIENVAIGDSNSWQVTPNKRADLLFVKPLSERAKTNMTVVTDRHTYLFDLVAAPGGKPLYVLRFTYPEPPKSEQDKALALAPNSLEMAAASDPYAVKDPAALNFSWEKKGDRRLFPDRVYDDGSATYVTWPSGKPIPAMLIKDKEGTEGPVNFAVRGDTLVIDGVPAEIILRSGRDNAELINQRPAREETAGATALAQAEGRK